MNRYSKYIPYLFNNGGPSKKEISHSYINKPLDVTLTNNPDSTPPVANVHTPFVKGNIYRDKKGIMPNAFSYPYSTYSYYKDTGDIKWRWNKDGDKDLIKEADSWIGMFNPAYMAESAHNAIDEYRGGDYRSMVFSALDAIPLKISAIKKTGMKALDNPAFLRSLKNDVLLGVQRELIERGYDETAVMEIDIPDDELINLISQYY